MKGFCSVRSLEVLYFSSLIYFVAPLSYRIRSFAVLIPEVPLAGKVSADAVEVEVRMEVDEKRRGGGDADGERLDFSLLLQFRK